MARRHRLSPFLTCTSETPVSGRYLPWSEVLEFIGEDFQVVPTLYRGPFDESLLSKWTSGKTLWGEGG